MIDCVSLDDDPTPRFSFSGIGSELLGFPSAGGVYVLPSPQILFFCSSSPWIVSQLLAHNASATQLQKMPSVNLCARLVLHSGLVCEPGGSGADCITKGEERPYLHRLAKDRRIMVYEIER
jgi:hypothetical protein